jgi:hypothetical protein
MNPSGPAVAPALRRLLEGDAAARQRHEEADDHARARVEGARRAIDEAVRSARAEAEIEAARICAEVGVATDAEVAAAHAELARELDVAEAAAETHRDAAVAFVVRWVTEPEP